MAKGNTGGSTRTASRTTHRPAQRPAQQPTPRPTNNENRRPKPMTPKAGFTQTRRRYGNGGKAGY